MLHHVTHGAPGAQPPLLIVHGLFGSARNWGVIARRMAEDRLVVVPDMRNHGDSAWDAAHGYEELAADLSALISAHGGQADVLGHSMGGKAAMQLALTEPARLRRLVVADIAPVAYGHSQRHLIAAMHALNLEGLDLRSEADRRLALSVPDAGVRAFLLQSLDLKAAPVRWKLNLAALDAEMERIVGWPGTPGRFEGRTLFVRGALSDYIRDAHRDAIMAQFPAAEFTEIAGAGHWLHADAPREFEQIVARFLA